MTKLVATAEPTTTVAKAAALMGRERVGATLVFKAGKLVGIFTERNILEAVGRPDFNPEDSVENWMTENPQSVGPEVSVEDALELMLVGRFRHLPVLDNAGKPIGMISMRDVASTFRPVSSLSETVAPPTKEWETYTSTSLNSTRLDQGAQNKD